MYLGRLSCQKTLVSGAEWSFSALSCYVLESIQFDSKSIVTLQIAQTHHSSTAAAIPVTIASQHELAISRPRHPSRKARTPNSTPRLLQPTTAWQGCSKPRTSKTHDSAPPNNSHDLPSCSPKDRALSPIGANMPDRSRDHAQKASWKHAWKFTCSDLCASCDLSPSTWAASCDILAVMYLEGFSSYWTSGIFPCIEAGNGRLPPTMEVCMEGLVTLRCCRRRG
jgi:hypothetical protein